MRRQSPLGTFAAKNELADGRLIPVLEPFDPQDREPLHLLVVAGSTTPVRVSVLVDFLAERLGPCA